MHQWLITQYETPASTRRTAVLVVRCEPQHLATKSRAHFFADGPLRQGDTESRQKSGDTDNLGAVRQTLDLLGPDQHMHPRTAPRNEYDAPDTHAWPQGDASQFEAEVANLKRRELLVAQKEAMITIRYKELRGAMLRAEELEFQLRQYSLGPPRVSHALAICKPCRARFTFKLTCLFDTYAYSTRTRAHTYTSFHNARPADSRTHPFRTGGGRQNDFGQSEHLLALLFNINLDDPF
jgi:hypothetical protein